MAAGDGGPGLNLGQWYPSSRPNHYHLPDAAQAASDARGAAHEDPIRCGMCGKAYRYDPSKGHSRSLCGTCKTAQARERMKEKAIDHLGGRCSLCGYARCRAALTFHPLGRASAEGPEAPAPRFFGRSWDRIRGELDGYALLCSNCDAEIRAGTTIPPRQVLVAQTAERGAHGAEVAGSRPAQSPGRRRT